MMETIPPCSSGRRGTAALPNSGKKKKKKLGVASLPKGGGGVTQENWRGASDSSGQEGKTPTLSPITATILPRESDRDVYAPHSCMISIPIMIATPWHRVSWTRHSNPQILNDICRMVLAPLRLTYSDPIPCLLREKAVDDGDDTPLLVRSTRHRCITEQREKKTGRWTSLPKGGGGVTQENWRGASDSLGQEGKTPTLSPITATILPCESDRDVYAHLA
jgi:hypothetical protein